MDPRERFERLHEGLAPSRTTRAVVPPAAPAEAPKRAVSILYDKRTADGVHAYQHKYAEGSEQKYALDRGGLPVFFTGRNVVTTRGIEDVPPSMRGAERLPPRPRHLVELGRLREIRYKSGSGEAVDRFPAREYVTLAHDEQGNLRAIHPPTRDGSSRREAMAHYMHDRRNPSATGELMSTTKTSLLVGGLGAASVVIINMVADKFPAQLPPGSYKRAAAKGAIAIAGGAAIYYVGRGNKYAQAAALGWAVVGTASALLDAYAAYQIRRAAPAAGAYFAAPQGLYGLPTASVPAGYGYQTQQACAVR